MGRIGATLSGFELRLLNRLGEANSAAALGALRLASGQRVLTPADDPSAFLTLSGLQSQLSNITAAMSNVTSASTMVQQVQTNLSSIRTQLATIRTELLEDQDRSLTAAERTEAQADIDAAIEEINSLARTSINGRSLLGGSANFNIAGRNSDQVTDLRVYSIVHGSTPAISGIVTQTATQAELVYNGQDGDATADAVITITGKRGSASVTVTSGDDLDDVAESINDLSHSTGVTASVDDDELTLQSVDYGGAANVTVNVTSGSFVVTGGNGSGTDAGTDASATINGIDYGPTTTATAAQLRHREATGLFAGDAEIRITGPLGSADFTINAGDTLAQIAADIEAQSGTTGVSASATSTDLVMTNDQTGSSAQLNILVLSGGFDTLTNYTAPGPATLTHHTAAGLITADAKLEITGVDGKKDVNLDEGDTLQQAAEAINDKTDDTGVMATVSGNDLLIQSVGTGPTAFAKIIIKTGAFEFEGGDPTGTAYGTNASASATGTDGSEGQGVVDGNRFTVNDNGLRYEIQFTAGFTGGFNRMTVSGEALSFAFSTSIRHRAMLSIPSLVAANLGGVSGRLDQLLSGGDLSGLDQNTSQALRVIDEAIGEIDKVEGAVDGFYDSFVSTSSDLLDDMKEDLETAIDETDGYDEGEETLLLAKNQELASNALSGLAILSQQRQSMVLLVQQIAGLT